MQTKKQTGITTPAKDSVCDKSNDFIMGRDPNIILRWIDRLATAVMVYFIGGGWLSLVAGVAWMVAVLTAKIDNGMTVFFFGYGGFHLAVGFLLRKFLVLPLHARLAIADAPPRSYPLNPLPETYPINTPPRTYPINPLPGRTVYQDKTPPK